MATSYIPQTFSLPSTTDLPQHHTLGRHHRCAPQMYDIRHLKHNTYLRTIHPALSCISYANKCQPTHLRETPPTEDIKAPGRKHLLSITCMNRAACRKVYLQVRWEGKELGRGRAESFEFIGLNSFLTKLPEQPGYEMWVSAGDDWVSDDGEQGSGWACLSLCC